ncbi:rhodanese-like domain-containing protein [Crocinitomix algicola]|uniref:rhodanese-like domain-containing protein n=1 Tax=Crocinitomix algicola TaxID=1740263 RepID=UPI000871D9A0|nr:rhodanese-like domain-containing protein [Crocinitomix algicola]
MGIFSRIFGGKRKSKVKELLEKGAIIIDVRNPGEFQRGHIKGSKNIPLQEIKSAMGKIKELEKPIIVCCASGVRSAQAKTILLRAGLEVENGGGWRSLK